MSSRYVALLTAFAGEIGLPSIEQFLKTKELINDGITISLFYEGDDQAGDVVLFSALGEILAERTAEILQVAMEANYLWAATGGATLGVSGNTLAMSLRIPLVLLDAHSLANVAGAFTQTATFWRRYTNGALERVAHPGDLEQRLAFSNKP
ncbi:Tir chaperone family protein [Bordetella tumbae]|uniref:type III secretion system chaperone n=1 Tax=Bordetella tumbae TaxID=1649139 RepID=UPI0039F149FD